MIIVNCALKQNDIIELLESIKINNENIFKFIGKQGIRLKFEVLQNCGNEVSIAKEAIRNERFGKALNFNIELSK